MYYLITKKHVGKENTMIEVLKSKVKTNIKLRKIKLHEQIKLDRKRR